MDLFNNPMVNNAKKAMTPEQIEEYKKIGEYMYNSDAYKTLETGVSVSNEPKQEDLVVYAFEALKAGLDPKELSQEELRAIIDTYGEHWYNRFGFSKNDVPVLRVNVSSKPARMSRQEWRFLKRKQKKLNKNK